MTNRGRKTRSRNNNRNSSYVNPTRSYASAAKDDKNNSDHQNKKSKSDQPTNLDNEMDIIKDSYTSTSDNESGPLLGSARYKPLNLSPIQSGSSNNNEISDNQSTINPIASSSNKETADHNERGDDPDPDILPDDTLQVDEQMFEYIDVNPPQIWKLAIAESSIPGKGNLQSKFKILARKFTGPSKGTHAHILELKKEKHVVIDFNNKEFYENILNAQHDLTYMDGEETKTEQFSFSAFEQIKPPKSQMDIEDEQQRSIRVTDIPIGMLANQVRPYFETYGEIESFRMYTKGWYQRAIIIYKSRDAVDEVTKQWFLYVGKYSLRIYPVVMDQVEYEKRFINVLKLSGLPKGTLPYDLHEIIMSINAKACVIPFNPRVKKPASYAFFYFESEDDVLAIGAKIFRYNQQELFWTTPDVPTCHHCGSPDHMIKECEILEGKKKPGLTKLQSEVYKKFRPANFRTNRALGIRTPKKPFNPQQPDRRGPGGTKSGGSRHGSAAEELLAKLNELEPQMQRLMTKVNLLQEEYMADKTKIIQGNISQKPVAKNGDNTNKRKKDDNASSPSSPTTDTNKKQATGNDKPNDNRKDALPDLTKYDQEIATLSTDVKSLLSVFKDLASKVKTGV